ncbi:MAG: glutathione S-transferase family protein [Pseudomonadota bacterium]|nr:glutathione S-transferase family protein [Pseudomonadota bacterium]
MVKLADRDIATREVLDWRGLHLFHFKGSSCSQKTRIFLNLKDIDWESHPLDLGAGENHTYYFLGINPRGLVPCLIFEGEVHIESNDIMTMLDVRYPERKLIPQGREDKMAALLHHEDELHLDLRTITFRFTQPRGRTPRSQERLVQFRSGGTGTVHGVADPNKQREIDFWERINRDGITDEAIRVSAGKFRDALDNLDKTLEESVNLLDDNLSILDIAWFIYVNRLKLCGYPTAQLHPHVETWFQRLYGRDEFRREVPIDPKIQAAIDENHRRQAEAGNTLTEVAEF